jgi:HAD superfamily hydrolase (TIGR01490 family)
MSDVKRIVFSDVDETLIRTKSLLDFLGFYFAGRYGAVGARHAEETRARLAALVAEGLSRADANKLYYRAWHGEPAQDVADWGERWFAHHRERGDFYVSGTLAALRRHRAQGARLVLVSGSFPAVLDPVAVDVGADHVLCTRPEVRDGVLTGVIVGAPMIGEGKRAGVRELLRLYSQVDPADCYGYGDHLSDLPMLEEVGHRFVVGDDPDLLAALDGRTAAEETPAGRSPDHAVDADMNSCQMPSRSSECPSG